MKPTHILGILPTINASACLLRDGEVIAIAEEERFSRIKTAGHVIPFRTIQYVLKEGEIGIGDLAEIAVAWDCTKYPDAMMAWAKANFPNRSSIDDTVDAVNGGLFNADFMLHKLRTGLRKGGYRGDLPPVEFYSHHLSHAASAFYPSGFEEALVLTLDGSGEENATVLWRGDREGLHRLREINLPHSLGWFYSAITEFLGFAAYTGEGKVMGLAPYGEPDEEIRGKLRKLLKLTEEAYEIDATYIYFDQRTYSTRFTDKLVDLLGEPATDNRNHSDYHKRVAFEVQFLLEEAVEHLVRKALAETGLKHVCIAGGVGMNCKMNGKVRELDCVEDLFVFPASSDNGTSLGAALEAGRKHGVTPNPKPISNVYFGPSFSNEEILHVLEYSKQPYRYCEDIAGETAKLIADSKIVGWFQGRMELGARALGNRSILGNPLNPEMKDIINARVKHREAFRPFCPSMLHEAMDDYLEDAAFAPFMIIAYRAKQGFAQRAPSVVHVDNTIRPQTVRSEDNPRFHALIKAFGEITGVPVILNTSFNVAGEPIVCKPEEAIRCWAGTGLDALAIGNYLLEKP